MKGTETEDGYNKSKLLRNYTQTLDQQQFIGTSSTATHIFWTHDFLISLPPIRVSILLLKEFLQPQSVLHILLILSCGFSPSCAP